MPSDVSYVKPSRSRKPKEKVAVHHIRIRQVTVMKTQSQLSAYGGDAVKVLGTVTLDCSHKDLHTKPLFYIVDTDNPPMFGLKYSIDLNVIKLVYTVQSSHTSQNASHDIMSEFKDVFTGIGLFPGECTIHLLGA